MTLLRTIFKSFLALLTVIFIGAIIFIANFDANNYKPQIIEKVEESTGRDFRIDGDLSLSFYPWIGLKVEKVALGNAKGFKAKEMASIELLGLQLKLLPLLKKQIEVKKVLLHGLSASLEVAKNKKSNWSDLFASEDKKKQTQSSTQTKEKTKQHKTVETEASKTDAVVSFVVEGIELVNANIKYDDNAQNNHFAISQLNLNTSKISHDTDINIQLSSNIKSNEPKLDSQLKLETQLNFNQDNSEIKLQGLILTLLSKAGVYTQQDETIILKGNVDILSKENKINLKQMEIEALGTTTEADFVVSNYSKSANVHGKIKVKPFNAKDVASRLDVKLPNMSEPDALNQVALEAALKVQGKIIKADKLVVNFDQSTLSGFLHQINNKTSFDLKLDKVNLNHYLPTPPATTKKTAVSSKTTATPSGDKIELPLPLLRKLKLQGGLQIVTLKFKEYDIKQMRATVKANNGIVNLNPLSMEMLDGKVAGSASLNVQQNTAVYQAKLNINQVEVAPVLNPYLKNAMGDKPLSADGKLSFNMNLKSQGNSVSQLKKMSNGQFVLDMKKTTVHGFDPEFFMRTVLANYMKEKGLKIDGPSESLFKPRNTTAFKKIFGNVSLVNGVLQTQNFIMDSTRTIVKAKGGLNILQNTLDSNVSINLPKEKKHKLLGNTIYLRVHGGLDSLKYSIDKSRLLDSAKQQVKAQVKEEVKQKVDEKKQQAKQKLKEKAKKKEDAVKDKLKDKLKNKFKGLF